MLLNQAMIQAMFNELNHLKWLLELSNVMFKEYKLTFRFPLIYRRLNMNLEMIKTFNRQI